MRNPLPASRAGLLIILTGGLLAGPALADGAWPAMPPAHGSNEEILTALEDIGGAPLQEYLFAAGLYRALERRLADKDPRVTDLAQLELLARALFSQGREEDAAELIAIRDDFSPELRLSALLDGEIDKLNDLDRNGWRATLNERDGASLYWRAHLETALGEAEQARKLLRELLRREPGSVYSSAALELLESLPLVEALPEPSSVADFVPMGYRIQWGVFRDPLRARRQREAVAAYGQKAEIIPFRKDGAELYRVCSPPFNEDANARTAAASLKERYGLDFVIHKEKNIGSHE
ncbi:MAG: SPOR domain-containing protein [bacterium]|nr:SPOR domain-containing protein [bacterium]